MKLAERHRINPRKKKEEKEPENEEGSTKSSSVRLRRKGCSDEPAVHYISKSVYSDSSSPSNESAEEFLKRINDEFSLKVNNDADDILSEIFKRGWKVPHIELAIGRTYLIRFFRAVGGNRSRTIQKKDKSIKKLLLRALEHVLKEEEGRYNRRMGRASRHKKDIK